MAFASECYRLSELGAQGRSSLLTMNNNIMIRRHFGSINDDPKEEKNFTYTTWLRLITMSLPLRYMRMSHSLYGNQTVEPRGCCMSAIRNLWNFVYFIR